MPVWKIAGVTVLVLAVAAAGAVWAPGVSGQEAKAREKKGNEPQIFTVRQGGPGAMALAEAFGQASGSRLGVEIRDVVPDDVTKMKLTSQSGVVIEQVTEASAAAKAGLKAGDVVVQFDGEQVRSASQFTRLVRETPVGRTVKMSVMRNGSRVELTATTEAQIAQFSWSGEGTGPDAERLRGDAERLRSEIERSVRERQRSLPERNYQFKVEPRVAPGPLADRFMWFGEGGPMGQLMSRGRLGVTIQDLTPELAEYFGVKDGVLVSSVEKDSAAAKAGIKAGDVITSVDGTAVTNGAGLVEQLRSKDGDVAIGVSREKKAMTLKATLDQAQPPRGRIIARKGA